jgi:hypothetical protein
MGNAGPPATIQLVGALIASYGRETKSPTDECSVRCESSTRGGAVLHLPASRTARNIDWPLCTLLSSSTEPLPASKKLQGLMASRSRWLMPFPYEPRAAFLRATLLSNRPSRRKPRGWLACPSYPAGRMRPLGLWVAVMGRLLSTAQVTVTVSVVS